ncbi:hypothetical protein [Desulfotomaculum sp. 1211_IL3151]|uniref:hypothetical protein n=1 Tax=Desulfotomaculum sp. 1211_IL3151 TaxID=3084055 RepID=UPI002FDA7481
MNIFAFFETFICLSTLGTIIPTIFLGKKLKPHYLPLHFILSGLMVGVLLSLSNTLSQIGLKDLWGIHTWIPVCLNLVILVYVIRLPVLRLKSCLEINFVIQTLLISGLPIQNQLFIENTLLSQVLTYTALTVSIIFVFYYASIFLSAYSNSNNITNLSTYLYIVLLVLIAFKPLSEAQTYITFITNFAIQLGFWPLSISLFIHLFLLPILSFIPYGIIKSLTAHY